MKKLFHINHFSADIDSVLLIARIGIAALMLSHGLPKLEMLLSGNTTQFPGVLGLGPAASLALAVFAEVLCSVLVLIGLGTRLAVIPLIATMATAVFHIHATDPLSKKELGLLYLLVYLVLLVIGSGRYSIDQLLQKKQAVALVKK